MIEYRIKLFGSNSGFVEKENWLCRLATKASQSYILTDALKSTIA
jgi:hypothetical protein